MNKLYKTLDLYDAWLVEINPRYNSTCGIKNIIGLKVMYNDENLFFSIFDDCFFHILLQNELKLKNFYKRLFVQIYEYQEPPNELKTFGMNLHDYINEDYITKQEIIEIKKNNEWLFGYHSDFSYELLGTTNKVNYENLLTIEESIIYTVQEYEEKLKRPLSYEIDCVYGPNHYKQKILK